jgi:hypothetical protein
MRHGTTVACVKAYREEAMETLHRPRATENRVLSCELYIFIICCDSVDLDAK